MRQKRQVKSVILETIKKQKMLSAGILTAVIGAVVAALIPPLILAKIIDTVTAGNEAAFSVILLYFVLLALTGILEAAREGLLTVFGQKITHALRSSLMDKFVSLTADSVNKQEPGTLVSRFVGDVDTVENLFTSGIISMFADVCKIISILVVIWFQNRGLTLVLLVLLPFLFWFTRHVQKNMLAAQIENRKAVGRASGHVPETLHNIRTIHCLAKEAYMEERYDTYIGESYAAMERTNFYDAVYSPVESLGMEIQTIQSAIAGIHRINEFFALEEKQIVEKDSETVAEECVEQMAGGHSENKTADVPFVEFRDVTFGYDEHVVLDHLNLKVMDAEQVTLAGRTGAGKSTILKLLLGLYEPQGGEVLIHGRPAAAVREEEKRKLFGYVEQIFHMVPGTVRDQITLYDETIPADRVKAVAELTGLDDVIESSENGYDTKCTPELFSQGQWQLLSIARAAVAEPQMLLFDEITANLDAETEKAVLLALKRVAKDRTVISISHRTSAELGRIIYL